MARETISSLAIKIGILTEKVINFMDTSKERQNETVKKIDTLSDKVNHQFTKLCERVTALENDKFAEVQKAKARAQIYKISTAILGIMVAVVGILKSLCII